MVAHCSIVQLGGRSLLGSAYWRAGLGLGERNGGNPCGQAHSWHPYGRKMDGLSGFIIAFLGHTKGMKNVPCKGVKTWVSLQAPYNTAWPLLRQDFQGCAHKQAAHKPASLHTSELDQSCPFRRGSLSGARAACKRRMASSSCCCEAAYEMRRQSALPNASPGTTAT